MSAWTETHQAGETEYVVRIQLIDRERSAGFADFEDPYCGEFFHADGTIDQGGLYRYLAKEYGRCTGKVFIDTTSGEVRQKGWVFEKRAPYDDVPSETFLQETWVSIYGRRVEQVPVDLGGRP
jgi:hypothetical protein